MDQVQVLLILLIIPFYFQKAEDPTKILQFRGTVQTLSHSATPQWNSKKYFGRPDSVHTYTGFDQNLSWSFTVYADGKAEMLGMYTNLNRLHGLLKPAWDPANRMIAPIVLLTIGDYVNEHPGFIKSLSISPDEQIYWDLGKHPIRGLPQALQILPAGITDQISSFGLNGKPFGGDVETAKVPRAFKINCTYQLIEKELPNSAGKGFWGNQDMMNGWGKDPKLSGIADMEGERWQNLQKYKQGYGKYLLYKGGL